MRISAKNLLRISALVVLALASALLIGWWRIDGPGAEQVEDLRPLPLTEMAFSLTAQDGRNVGPDDLVGKPSLVFFGFTSCPDVCPTTLSDISSWLDELGPEAELLNAVLISVDPERDTVDALAEYLSYFDPRIEGWTGTDDQIAAIARDFRATYEKVVRSDGTYTMNHTAGVFVFRADGSFANIVDYHEPRAFAVPKIRRAIRAGMKRTET